jgi:hypothetical protein
MMFQDAPRPSERAPNGFALHEEAACRLRAKGDEPWAWLAGVVSPKLPDAAASCK